MKKRNIIIFISIIIIAAFAFIFQQISVIKKDNASLHNQNKFIMKHLSGGVQNIPKTYGTLRARQEHLVECLKMFDQFAKKHDIEYWLDFGTLLGAKRHGGFIPWDDDIDVSMTDDNLEKLKSIPQDDKFYISLKPQYTYRERGTLWFFNNSKAQLDIFVHTITDKKSIADQIKYIGLLRAFRIFVPNWEQKLLDNYDSIRIKDYKNRNIEDLVIAMRTSKYQGLDSISRGNFKMSDVLPLKTAKFEGYDFPVPNNTEAVLSIRFGDFMDLPDSFGYSHHLGIWGSK